MAGNDERVNLLISALVDGLENVAALSGELRDLEKAGQDQVPDNTQDLREGADETRGTMEGLRANIGKVVAAGAALGGIAATLKSVSGEAAEYETRMRKLEGVVRATGGAAGFTAQEIRTMSQELALGTLGSVEEFENAAAALLTFKSISGDAFGQALELSKDLAEVMGGDAQSAARQLGRALEDPDQGLSMLRRSGVSFTESQREVIKSLVDTGRVAEAQKLILEQVANQVGGVARAMADGTLAGSLDTLGQRFEELKVASGEAINPALTSLVDDLAGVLELMAGNLDEIAATAKVVGSVALTAFAVRMAGAVATANVSLLTMSATLKAMPAQINSVTERMSKLQKAVSLVGAAFVGWEIGSYLKDEFVEVEQAGIALSAGLTKLAERARFAFEVLSTPVDSNTLENISAAYDRMQVKLTEIDQIYGEMFANAGKVTGAQAELGNELDRTGEKVGELSNDFMELDDALQEVIQERARKAVQDLNDDLGKLGVDPERFRSGLSTIEAETIQAFQRIASNPSATGEQLAASFTASLGRLSSDAIPVLGVSLKKALDSGKISAKEFEGALEGVTGRLSAEAEKAAKAFSGGEITASEYREELGEIERAAQELGVTLPAVFRAATDSADDAGDKARELGGKLKETGDVASETATKVEGAFDSFGAALTRARESVTSLSKEARNLLEVRIGGDAFVEETEDAAAALQKANQEVYELSQAGQRLMSNSFADWFNNVALQAARVRQEFYEQQVQLESLTDRVNAGAYSMEELARISETAANKFSLLDDQNLSALQGAIDAAKRKLESLSDSADSTLNSLRQRLADIRGDTEEAQRLQFEAERKRLQEQLEEARQAGADAAAADYQEALDTLEKINAIEQKNRREEDNARERAAADRQREQERAARERREEKRQINQPVTSATRQVETVRTINVNLNGETFRLLEDDEDAFVRALEQARGTVQ
ncbi:phage tail length tape measure family protein [Marinobacter sp. CA1]|uniref:phage tail length tape measure family protein n=1 Tax=Marinobacter sp. CA1 TaxID=2817656 RepID=UPI001D08BBB1|nr:phage tail length tape measure family protein [Marinobacter sp. CA1]UDL03972.1 phage tail length tape measure family protein [Marinobacter sp. CA1]